MNFAITGHTSGIGKALYDRVGGIGISRTTGFDITNPDNYKRIRAAVDDCDVFVNNAYNGFGQSQLLMYLYREWVDTRKTIVNIGSNVADVNIALMPVNLLEYWMHKRSLRDTSVELGKLPTQLNVEYRTFGYVGTDAIRAKYPHLPGFITVDQAVDQILKGILPSTQ